eukprot:843905-Prymnesium_polylepis.1
MRSGGAFTGLLFRDTSASPVHRHRIPSYFSDIYIPAGFDPDHFSASVTTSVFDVSLPDFRATTVEAVRMATVETPEVTR